MRWVVFTNVYVAFCGAALTAASYALFGLSPRLDTVVALVFCCTLVIYNLDRLVEPRPGDSEHERWVQRHRPMLWAITLISAVAAIGLATQLSVAVLISLVIAGIASVGYCLPVVRYRKRWRRLKALPGAKLVLIALVWTYATAGLPMLAGEIALNSSTMMVLLARLFFIAAVALPFDLPDMQRDRRSGIATLPTMLGVAATRRVGLVLIATSMALSLLTPWPYAIALLISSVCTAGLIALLKTDRGLLYFMVVLDGMLLLQAGLLWLLADEQALRGIL